MNVNITLRYFSDILHLEMTAIYYSWQIDEPIEGKYSHKKMGTYSFFYRFVFVQCVDRDRPNIYGVTGYLVNLSLEDVKRWQAKTGLSLQISGDKCPKGPFWHPNRYLLYYPMLSESCHNLQYSNNKNLGQWKFAEKCSQKCSPTTLF